MIIILLYPLSDHLAYALYFHDIPIQTEVLFCAEYKIM